MPLVEASHFLGSVAGLVLLFVARGLLHRLDAAWWAATGLAAVLMLLALPKGIAVAELVVFGFLLLVLVLTRREFDRRASLFSQTFSPGWWLAIGSVLAATVWLLLSGRRREALACRDDAMARVPRLTGARFRPCVRGRSGGRAAPDLQADGLRCRTHQHRGPLRPTPSPSRR